MVARAAAAGGPIIDEAFVVAVVLERLDPLSPDMSASILLRSPLSPVWT
jgi:hypothetical protein